MFHDKLYEALFENFHITKKVSSDILGLFGIEHFSLDIVDPTGKMIFFSTTPAHGYEICKAGYGQYDGIISQEYYKNYEFYWWKNAAHKKYANNIEEIREQILGLKHGFMLVRCLNNFYIMYSFATKSNSLNFQTTVINNINEYLSMGDYAYNTLRPIY